MKTTSMMKRWMKKRRKTKMKKKVTRSTMTMLKRNKSRSYSDSDNNNKLNSGQRSTGMPKSLTFRMTRTRRSSINSKNKQIYSTGLSRRKCRTVDGVSRLSTLSSQFQHWISTLTRLNTSQVWAPFSLFLTSRVRSKRSQIRLKERRT